MEELLLNEIEVDLENGDFRFISKYETILQTLKELFGSHEIVVTLEETLDELKTDAEDWRCFEAIKAETLSDTGDEYLAEDVAWELVYA